MTTIQKISTFFLSLLKTKGATRLNPQRDWIVVLIGGLILILSSVWWNTWFFFSTLHDASVVLTPVHEENIDTAVIEKAKVFFETRAQEAQRYKTEYRFIDPSK